MKKLLFILLLTTPFIGFGQGWEKTFGSTQSDFGMSIQQTIDGGYIILGNKGYPNSDFWLIKTNNNGDLVWDKNFGLSSYDDGGWSVKQTTDGGYILTGRTRSFGGGINDKVWLIKTDSNGDQQWDQLFSGGVGWSWGHEVIQTNDGGYSIIGRTGSIGQEMYWLIKTDINGTLLWEKKYQSSPVVSGSGFSIQQTNDEGYIIVGSNSWVIRTDYLGDTIWTKTLYSSSCGVVGESRSVKLTNDGGFIICGEKPSNGQEMTIFKLDSLGNIIWDRCVNQIVDGCSTGRSITQTNDGGYVVVGTTSKTCVSGSQDLWLVKTNSLGDTLWTKKFGEPNFDDNGIEVQQTNDGGYIICGITESYGNGGKDIYVIKTDGNGNITSTFNIPTPSSNRKLENVVDILGRETKPQPNTPFIEIYDDGSTEKKIVIE